MNLVMPFLSLGISVIQHALNRKVQFIHVRSLAMPLLFLLAVVLVTARFTGGFGLKVAGSANVGGRRYLFMFGAIAGYFALAAHRIPPKKALLYIVAFYVGAMTVAISDLPHFMPFSAPYYLLIIFPPSNVWEGPAREFVAGAPEIGRLGGIGGACVAVACCMMAVYGIGGIFTIRKFWRAPIFLAATVGCLSAVIVRCW